MTVSGRLLSSIDRELTSLIHYSHQFTINLINEVEQVRERDVM